MIDTVDLADLSLIELVASSNKDFDHCESVVFPLHSKDTIIVYFCGAVCLLKTFVQQLKPP